MFISTQEEEERKRGKFAYNMQEYDFLLQFNGKLKDLEEKLFNKDVEDPHPNIFILGLPRSGTTFITQLIFNNLDVACVNNLNARFWDAPLCGTLLSKIVLGDTKIESYNSKYARTDTISSPHEFGYFWRQFFFLDDPKKSYPPDLEAKVDWEKIRAIILNMNAIREKGFVFKTLEISGYFLKRFYELFPRSIFVYIDRNKVDMAISIAKARLDHYNDINTWWSSYPLEYSELEEKPYWDQIGGQIFYLSNMFEKNMKEADARRIIRIDYEDMCKNPNALIEAISLKVKTLFNYELKQINSPEPFKISRPKIDMEIEKKLVLGLSKYDLVK